MWKLCGILTFVGLTGCYPEGGDVSRDTPQDVLKDARSGQIVVEKQPDQDTLQGQTRLQGQVVGGGAPCVQFRTDAGQQISLEGASPQDFQTGQRFEITGRFVDQSRCMQGPGFVITQHSLLP